MGFELDTSDRMLINLPPSHVILKEGEIPLNRVAKTDYLTLRERAAQIVQELRSRGGWDRR